MNLSRSAVVLRGRRGNEFFMPFVADVRLGEHYQIQLVQNELEAIARIPLGHDPVTNVQYSVGAQLIRLPPFDGELNTELLFNIGEHDGERLRFVDDGRKTKAYLQGDDRKLALNLCVQPRRFCLNLENLRRFAMQQ